LAPMCSSLLSPTNVATEGSKRNIPTSLRGPRAQRSCATCRTSYANMSPEIALHTRRPMREICAGFAEDHSH
jgi:hypothetical protein